MKYWKQKHTTMRGWIPYGRVSDLQHKYETTFAPNTEPPVQTNDQKLIIYKKQMETLQSDMSTQVINIKSKLSAESVPGSQEVYAGMLSGIKDNLNGQFENLMQQILTLDVGNLQQNLDELELFRKNILSSISATELLLAEKVPSNPSPSSHSSCSSVPRGVKMENSIAPTFSGNTIDYPEFKRGWNKVAGVAWDDGNQVEQIKLKVDAKTKRILTRCETMSEVWDAMDNEFAQEGELIYTVNEELHKFRSTDCSTEQYIVNLGRELPTHERAL